MISVTAAIIVLLVIVSVFYVHKRGAKVRRTAVSGNPLGTRPSASIPGDAIGQITLDPPSVVETPANLKRGTGRARSTFRTVLGNILRTGAQDEDVWLQLEETLLLSDLGLNLTTQVLDSARVTLKQAGVSGGLQMIEAVKAELLRLFMDGNRELEFSEESPTVWLIVGVNGVGKTTSIGKLSAMAKADDKKVLLAAGDTFRAAAADQLQMWAERTEADIVRSVPGADPSSVVFDGIQKAAARGFDLVIADTAGRLHTKSNLMDELRKLRRVAEKAPGHLREVLLVLDATTGQNGLVQAKEFAQAAGVTGVILTKLDGSAKGGIAIAVEAGLGVPIKLVGVGERAQDLIPFSPTEFLDALLEVDRPDDSGEVRIGAS